MQQETTVKMLSEAPKPQYTTEDRDRLQPPQLFAGMWILNIDTMRPEKYTGEKWMPLPIREKV